MVSDVSDDDLGLMRRALAQAASAADAGEVPVGAAVRHDPTGRVLAEAHNRRELDQDPTAHAELLAVRAAAAALGSWRLIDCTLAVTLEPCPMCAGLLVNARLSRLIYAAADPKAGAVRSLMQLCEDPRLNHRVVVVAEVLADEGGEILRAFFRSCREAGRATGAGGPGRQER